jgi:glycine cleavage system aminomethyltransferase T
MPTSRVANRSAPMMRWSGSSPRAGDGHTLQKPLALAMVSTDTAAEGAVLEVHVVGIARKARVVAPSPCDLTAGVAGR